MIQNNGGKTAIRKGDWKLIPATSLAKGGVDELYNLKEDIGEKNNLAEKQPEVVQQLKSRLKELQ